nr:uncharacterized protein LOC113713832 [Coffea arabica]
MNYLEAYNEASALASNEQERKRSSSDAHLVDEYNKSKRSKPQVDKHQELAQNRSKKKSKQEPVKEEWEGKHPWRPWDRKKDLTAGRQSVKLNAENMARVCLLGFPRDHFKETSCRELNQESNLSCQRSCIRLT